MSTDDQLSPLQSLKRYFFGASSLRAVPGKSSFNDLETLGVVHYLPGINVLHDSKLDDRPTPDLLLLTSYFSWCSVF